MSLHDPEGVELSDLDVARARAFLEAREIIAEEVKQGRVPLGWWIEITDGDGNILEVVRFRDTVMLQ